MLTPYWSLGGPCWPTGLAMGMFRQELVDVCVKSPGEGRHLPPAPLCPPGPLCIGPFASAAGFVFLSLPAPCSSFLLLYPGCCFCQRIPVCLSGMVEADTGGQKLATQHCPFFLVPPISEAPLPPPSIPGHLHSQQDGSQTKAWRGSRRMTG